MEFNLIEVGLSLIIGFTFGISPFVLWRLILPAVVKHKKCGISNPAHKVKGIILNGVLVIKFFILGVLLYFLIKLPWLNISVFIIGLIMAPLFIISYVLIKNYISMKESPQIKR